MKGESKMECKHKRIKSVNCELFCIDCGEKLPDSFLMLVNGQKQAENRSAEDPKEKPTNRKRTAKKDE